VLMCHAGCGVYLETCQPCPYVRVMAYARPNHSSYACDTRAGCSISRICTANSTKSITNIQACCTRRRQTLLILPPPSAHTSLCCDSHQPVGPNSIAAEYAHPLEALLSNQVTLEWFLTIPGPLLTMASPLFPLPRRSQLSWARFF